MNEVDESATVNEIVVAVYCLIDPPQEIFGT